MDGQPVQFYSYAQELALQTFLPLLRSHLPTSNPLFNRLIAPHNVPSRHCLFAATVSPSNIDSSSIPPVIPEIYTLLFADRSRHLESQIWLFNPLITYPQPLSASNQIHLMTHLESTILFLKNIQIPQAPGWPFLPILKFGCLHETLATTLLSIGNAKGVVRRQTIWNLWLVETGPVSKSKKKKELPEGFSMTRVPDEQLDLVLSTSSIPRQAETLKQQPSVGLLDQDGKMVAWGYIGIDASFATLYVLPEFRGRGLAKSVAVELIGRLGRGEFVDLGYDGRSGWVHSDVYEGNEGSESVMRSLGGRVGWKSIYMWIDSEMF
ncbi:hypothetical protein ONS95_013051 [Cadophora gregata]|uniref:uncharacterized protein n=1 Tax=Cadophora gregata TaxID=51156 RepID=UPI0026DC0B21|nr:uncharacterized protein ONS95_013051 [Cadophora gregata]KAK0100960.1 hypothetical protein ONS96_006192 [Cadophora gregata f. sp. sojae]KAK0116014.1 hypothetical protein ONS95_013051 [Cadophora gregata]